MSGSVDKEHNQATTPSFNSPVSYKRARSEHNGNAELEKLATPPHVHHYQMGTVLHEQSYIPLAFNGSCSPSIASAVVDMPIYRPPDPCFDTRTTLSSSISYDLF